jgi:hypothetical protein
MSLQVKIYKIVNFLLLPLNVAIAKRSTLKSLERTQRHYESTPQLQPQPLQDFSAQSSQCLSPQYTQAMSAQYAQCLRDVKDEILRHQNLIFWEGADAAMKLEDSSANLCCEFCGHTSERADFQVYKTLCVFGGGRLIRYQCPECDIIFGDEKILKLTAEELAEEYKHHYRVYSEGDSSVHEKRAFFALKPKKTGVYLNFGAGDWNTSTADLRAEGWNVYSYEPHSSDKTESNSEYLIQTEEQLATMRFDGIFSNNVLEHFRHPDDVLRSMSKFLCDDGRMSHSTPCFEYLYEYTKFHLFFFLGRSKQLLADKAQLLVEEYIKDGEFMCLVLSKKKAN